MKIAVDAVGGDHYPQAPVTGAIQAIEENDQLQIILIGPEKLVKDELNKYTFPKDRIRVLDAPDIISMDESPSKAVKGKPYSSIAVGLGLHKKGECDAFVSAGNTGALLAASIFIMGKLEGVIRPTIATQYPTVDGFRLLVDAGANLELRPDVLYQCGVMGEIYTREIMGIQKPRIGLVNVGEEAEKGTETLKEAYQLLKKHAGFIGNVEGRDILMCKADVFVCDGLVGNILLKFGESLLVAFQTLFQKAVQKNNLTEDQQKAVTKVLQDVIHPFDYESIGGVPFLGINGVSLVGHGSSSAKAVKNMIYNAVLYVENKVNQKIVTSLNQKF